MGDLFYMQGIFTFYILILVRFLVFYIELGYIYLNFVYLNNMEKKTPASNVHKKVTASARAKISTRKVRKVASQVDGSYIQDSNGVSTVGNFSEPVVSSSSYASNADIL